MEDGGRPALAGRECRRQDDNEGEDGGGWRGEGGGGWSGASVLRLHVEVPGGCGAGAMWCAAPQGRSRFDDRSLSEVGGLAPDRFADGLAVAAVRVHGRDQAAEDWSRINGHSGVAAGGPPDPGEGGAGRHRNIDLVRPPPEPRSESHRGAPNRWGSP